ncbi:hypothetical protein J2X85_002508 [Microbacterium trichothecenolyticum]|jgi:hypothetical protein|nr:hypothetical protein [Microbacterium trichothecenolyticum]
MAGGEQVPCLAATPLPPELRVLAKRGQHRQCVCEDQSLGDLHRTVGLGSAQSDIDGADDLHESQDHVVASDFIPVDVDESPLEMR